MPFLLAFLLLLTFPLLSFSAHVHGGENCSDWTVTKQCGDHDDADHLFTCDTNTNIVSSTSEECEWGCMIMSGGVDDMCYSQKMAGAKCTFDTCKDENEVYPCVDGTLQLNESCSGTEPCVENAGAADCCESSCVTGFPIEATIGLAVGLPVGFIALILVVVLVVVLLYVLEMKKTSKVVPKELDS